MVFSKLIMIRNRTEITILILDLYLYPFSLTQNEPFLSKKHFGQVDILDGVKFFEILERFVWVKFCQKTFLGKFFSFALVNIADTFVPKFRKILPRLKCRLVQNAFSTKMVRFESEKTDK